MTESTITPTTVFNATYYGGALPAYWAFGNFAYNSSVTSTGSAIMQAEQEHSVGAAWIDFYQCAGVCHYTRNGATNAARTGTVMHHYGATTTLYTTAAQSLAYSGTTTSISFYVMAPSNTLPVAYRRVSGGHPMGTEERTFTPDSATVDFSQRGMSKVWSNAQLCHGRLHGLSFFHKLPQHCRAKPHGGDHLRMRRDIGSGSTTSLKAIISRRSLSTLETRSRRRRFASRVP